MYENSIQGNGIVAAPRQDKCHVSTPTLDMALAGLISQAQQGTCNGADTKHHLLTSGTIHNSATIVFTQHLYILLSISVML
jgi:hypothetical protein